MIRIASKNNRFIFENEVKIKSSSSYHLTFSFVINVKFDRKNVENFSFCLILTSYYCINLQELYKNIKIIN